MGGGTQRRQVHSGTGAPIKPPEPSDGKRRLIRGEGLIAPGSAMTIDTNSQYESELQQINLRNEAPNQITVDTCGERCAQLDDFNWFLPMDEWDEKSDTPESEIDTSDSENGVYVNASDSSPSQTETATQRLLAPPPPPPRWPLRRDLKGAVRLAGRCWLQ